MGLEGLEQVLGTGQGSGGKHGPETPPSRLRRRIPLEVDSLGSPEVATFLKISEY